jgi:O-antigen/teichoic acid export membrane protein
MMPFRRHARDGMRDSQESRETALSAGELQRRAISGSAWTVITTLVSVPIAFVANAVVARSLDVGGYGQLAFLTASLAFAVTFANFGFSTSAVQRGSRAEAGGRRFEADELLRRSLGFHMIVELPILLLVALGLTRGDPWWVVVALLIAVVSTTCLSGGALSFTIENRTALGAQLSIALNVALQGASVATALSTRSPSAVWAVRTLVPALALAVNFLLLEPRRRRAALRPRFPKDLARDFWRYAVFSWASGLLALLVYSRSEIFLLQLLHKREALGLFALAFGLSQFITAPADALLHPLLPAISGILSAWPDRALAAFKRSTRVSTLICGGIAAAVIPPLVFVVPMIYGSTFASARWLFVPLALLSTFQSASNPILAFVNARQRGAMIFKATAVALVVDVVVAVTLIPVFGAWGAVVANVLGQPVGLVWLAVTEPLAMEQGLRGLPRLYRPFLLGAAAGVVALGTGSVLEDASAILAAAGAVVAGGGLFITAVRVTRAGLSLQDVDALVGAMAKPIQPCVSWLLRPVTTPTVA